MKERQKQEEILESQNDQLEAFILAENEVINQVEALLERKKEQIVHETHEIYWDNNFESLHDWLKEVTEQISSKKR